SWQQVPNGLEENGLIELALHDVALRADLLAAQLVAGVASGGHQDGGRVAKLGVAADRLDELEAAHPRHLDIDDEEPIRALASLLQSVFGRDCQIDSIPG